MRFISESKTRLLAAVISLSVAAATGTILLTGCGGGASSTLTTATGGGTGSASYAGRSYTVRNLVLSGDRAASVTLQVSANNAISGVLTLTNPADTVALTGTLNRATGAYQLTGSLTRDSGQPITVQGTLPTPPSVTGGSLTLTIGGQTITATFSMTTSTPTPTPTPTTGIPTPNPTPSSVPGTGNGTLFDYYSAFTTTTNDTYTYQFTNNRQLSPDPNGDSGTSVDQGTIHGGVLFGAAFAGQKTTVTIALPISGSKTVTRQEQLNTNTNAVVGYTYYTEDASGRTDYGEDSLFNNIVISSTRNDNGVRIPFSLSPGQTYSQTYTVFETQFDFNGTKTGEYSYVEQETIKFVGIENTSVLAGTYSNTAHLHDEVTYTLPAIATGGGGDQPTTEKTDLYLSKFVGLVLLTNQKAAQNVSGRVNTTNQDFTYTETEDGRDELVSATVNGTNYPPGRSVTAIGGTFPKHFNFSLHGH